MHPGFLRFSISQRFQGIHYFQLCSYISQILDFSSFPIQHAAALSYTCCKSLGSLLRLCSRIFVIFVEAFSDFYLILWSVYSEGRCIDGLPSTALGIVEITMYTDSRNYSLPIFAAHRKFIFTSYVSRTTFYNFVSTATSHDRIGQLPTQCVSVSYTRKEK